MLGTIIVPFGLSLLRILKDGYKIKEVTLWMLIFGAFISPILPLILLFLQGITALKIRHSNEHKIKKWQNWYMWVKEQTSRFCRTEFGLEITIQITFNILLLMFTRSETRTEEGLDQIFDDQKPIFGIPVNVLLFIAIALSFKSAWTSYVKGISLKKEYFPFTSKLFIAVYVYISVSLKVFSNIIFLTPPLGLFNLLRHYQGELLPYTVIVNPPRNPIDSEWILEPFPKVNLTSDLMYYSNATPILWSKITRFDYTNPQNPIKPKLEDLYTTFPIETYLNLFWIILFIQPLIIYVVKKSVNPIPFSRLDWLDKLIHCMENAQVPSPIEDFEEQPGTVAEHIERYHKINKEIGATIIANFLQRLLMFAPIINLCKLYRFLYINLISIY